MATIDDFGQTNEPLSAPVFGGPSGWAAAVRDYLKNLDVRVRAGANQTGSDAEFYITFNPPMASADYSIAGTTLGNGGILFLPHNDRTVNGVTVRTVNFDGNLLPDTFFSWVAIQW